MVEEGHVQGDGGHVTRFEGPDEESENHDASKAVSSSLDHAHRPPPESHQGRPQWQGYERPNQDQLARCQMVTKAR